MSDQMKTTFIPKQSLGSVPAMNPYDGGTSRVRASSSVSILTLLATLIFFVTVISFAGVFLIEKNTTARIAEIEKQLVSAEKQFEPSLIQELRDLDFRLKIADKVLREHRSIAPFFTILQDTTSKKIEYTHFQFDTTDTEQSIVQIKGRARDFEAIAEQSEIFGQERLIREYIFSNFILQNDSRVQFDLTVSLSPELTIFEKSFPLFNTAEVITTPESLGDSI